MVWTWWVIRVLYSFVVDSVVIVSPRWGRSPPCPGRTARRQGAAMGPAWSGTRVGSELTGAGCHTDSRPEPSLAWARSSQLTSPLALRNHQRRIRGRRWLPHYTKRGNFVRAATKTRHISAAGFVQPGTRRPNLGSERP